MPRIRGNEIHYRKTDIIKYIQKLMVEKQMTQKLLADRLGKTQSWVSKKFEHCSFYTGELLEVFRVLEADPIEVGKLMVIKEKR